MMWINPNDKTQARYLPNIGEPVLFCHQGKTYLGKHTGGSFKESTPPFRRFNTWQCYWMYPPAAVTTGEGGSEGGAQPLYDPLAVGGWADMRNEIDALRRENEKLKGELREARSSHELRKAHLSDLTRGGGYVFTIETLKDGALHKAQEVIPALFVDSAINSEGMLCGILRKTLLYVHKAAAKGGAV